MSSSPDNRPLSTYPIPPTVQAKLLKSGFLSTGSLKNLRPSELSSSSEITLEEAADVLELTGSLKSLALETRSAYEILLDEQQNNSIVTFSKTIDDALGSGIPLCKLTEVSGIAGVGKTQFCLQLCVSVQIPKQCGGLGGHAIYIDTEGSFSISRIEDMAMACINHCSKFAKLDTKSWNFNSIIEHIYVFRCKELTELMSCVMILKEFLKSHNMVRLIVVDSLAFHFRHDLDNAALRSRVLHRIASQLSMLAIEWKIAVVVTNQMTTKFDSTGEGRLTPALGTSWGHAPTFRLLLHWDPSHTFRWLTLIKSSSLPPLSAPYQVTKDGIRDVIFSEPVHHPVVEHTEDGIPYVKIINQSADENQLLKNN